MTATQTRPFTDTPPTDFDTDPGIVAAEARFFEVVYRLWCEDANNRLRHALEEFGCVLVVPAPAAVD